MFCPFGMDWIPEYSASQHVLFYGQWVKSQEESGDRLVINALRLKKNWSSLRFMQEQKRSGGRLKQDLDKDF